MTKGGVLVMKLGIGTIISIDKDFSKENEKYKSKIIDIGIGHVMIDYPTHITTGKTAFFLDGTQFLVSFTDQLKNSYYFKTEVNGRFLKGVPMLKLSYPGDDQLIQIQRREFVRTDAALDVAVLKDGEYTQLIAEDISAGGLALNFSSAKYSEKDLLSLLIVLPFKNKSMKYIRTDAEIIRITESANKKVASIKFNDISLIDRQQIVRFCFEQELRMRNG